MEEDDSIPVDVHKIDLEFKKFVSQAQLPYEALRSSTIMIDQHPAFRSMLVRMTSHLAGEPLTRTSFRYPRDWQSACWAAFAHWLGQRRWRGCFARWRDKVRNHAMDRAHFVIKTWEVRREWLDMRYDGQRTKVVAYLNGEPLMGGMNAARAAFHEAYGRLRQELTPRSLETDPDGLVYELLEAAEYVDWRRGLQMGGGAAS